MDSPALVVGLREAVWLAPGGAPALLDLAAARRRIEAAAPLVIHARATARRLGLETFPALDLLELYAFVHPATFCVPTARGLAVALDLEPPIDRMDAAVLLPRIAAVLLADLARDGDAEARAVARAMGRGGWIWAPHVLGALGVARDPDRETVAGLEVWRGLGEWWQFMMQLSPPFILLPEV